MPLPQRLVFLLMGLSLSLAYSELISRPVNEDAMVLDLGTRYTPETMNRVPFWSTQTENEEGMGLQVKHDNIDKRKGERL